MRHSFYDSPTYKEKQRALTRRNWQQGILAVLRRRVERACIRPGCGVVFSVKPSDPKRFCSRSCAACFNNRNRAVSEATKQKISAALAGHLNPYKNTIKVERIHGICQNPTCDRPITFERWQPRKFCSNICAMAVIGGRPTSPRAARAKAGVRTDLGNFYFYSRWEANFARVLNFFGVRWQYQPKTFDLGKQRYTPDFYLPEYDMFVEIKNFLSPFSADRDRRFRERYPHAQLFLLLKDDYLIFESELATKVQNWEYST